MEVQRTMPASTSKDQGLLELNVEENANLKVAIPALRKQLQDKELDQGQTKESTFSPKGETSKQPRQRKE